MIRLSVIAGVTLALAACQAEPGPAEAQPTAAAAATTAAGGVADPVRFVRAAYGADSAAPDRPSPPEVLDQDRPEYSPRLRSYFALQQREHGKDEVGRLDMDIFTSAQDGDVSEVVVESRDVDFAEPPRRIVDARFKLNGEPRAMTFYFEKVDARWFLDDIAFPGEKAPATVPPWTLSLVLKYGW